MLSAADRLAQDIGEEEPRSTGAHARGDGLFAAVNAISTVSVLDFCGIEHDDKFATCPGCGEDGALLCKDGGIKCLHNRCSGVGPARFPGFRSNVDIVDTVKGGGPLGAARLLAEQFGIPMPNRSSGSNGSHKQGEQDDFDEYYRAQAEDDGSTPDPPEAEQNHGSQQDEQPQTKKSPTTPADVIRRWREEGMLPRVGTGIATLDRLCGGGLLIPRRVVLVGAPSAGKTYLESTIANLFGTVLGTHGFNVGMLAVDEDDSDLTVRLAQMAGYPQAQCEERDPETLDRIESALSDRRIRFYDNQWTIEEAAADVAAWSKGDGRFGALCVDSLHSVRSARSDTAETSRAMVEGNVAALRWAYDVHRLTIIATAEMNRMGYATVKSASEANPLALSAESRATEYFAQVLLSLQPVKDQPNLVHVQVAKNRGARRGEFWLELDHASHGMREVPDPEGNPEVAAQKQEKTQAANRAEVMADAKTLARIVRENPGTNDADLRTAVAKAGIRWGTSRFEIAKSQLQDGAHGVHLVDRSGSASGSRNPRQWFVEPIEEDSRS